ncbi:MAG: ion transporter [Ignavibacteria bacterium]|nr:ion transporter [Ignavibacteria bacterium]
MVELCRKISESKWFPNFIIGVIFLAGIVVGLQTDSYIQQHYGEILIILDNVILYIFVFEIVIKMIAKSPRPWEFFKDGWNVFDFIIVAVCFLPFGGPYVAVLRLARILRVLRLVSALPKLQVLVGALIKSIPSMSYVGLLLLLLFYIYAVMGTYLFGQNDPLHFGSIGASMMTLFEIITLEGWIDVFNIQVMGSNVYTVEALESMQRVPSAHPVAAPVYFISFILLGTMIMLNLFIGIIINGMEETNREETIKELAKIREQLHGISLEEEINLIQQDIEKINENLKLLRNRISAESGGKKISQTDVH